MFLFSFLLSFFVFFPNCVFWFWHRPGQENVRVSSNEAASVTDAISSLSIGDDAQMKTEPTAEHHPVVGVLECKCGMPLCICEAPAPPKDALPLQVYIVQFL